MRVVPDQTPFLAPSHQTVVVEQPATLMGALAFLEDLGGEASGHLAAQAALVAQETRLRHPHHKETTAGRVLRGVALLLLIMVQGVEGGQAL